MKEREIKYDFLRAVAVLAIIMVHAIPAVSVNDKQWWFAAVMQPLLLSFVGIIFYAQRSVPSGFGDRRYHTIL